MNALKSVARTQRVNTGNTTHFIMIFSRQEENRKCKYFFIFKKRFHASIDMLEGINITRVVIGAKKVNWSGSRKVCLFWPSTWEGDQMFQRGDRL